MLPETLLKIKKNVPHHFGYLQRLGYLPFLCEEDKVSDLVKLLGARSILFSFINKEKTLLVEFQFIKFPDTEDVVSAATVLNLSNQESFVVEDYVRWKALKRMPEFPVEEVIKAYEALFLGELFPIVSGKTWESVPY